MPWQLTKNEFLWQHLTQNGVDESPQPTPKAELHGRKVTQCVWWERHGIIHFEFLNFNQTLNTDLYYQQTDRMHKNLQRKHPALFSKRNIVLLHDNARLNSARISKEKLVDLCWPILPYPSYSPDLALSDYFFFSILFLVPTKGSECEKISQKDPAETFVGNFLSLKLTKFYSLLNYSLTNYILLKWKLLMTQPNIYLSIYLSHTHA